MLSESNKWLSGLLPFIALMVAGISPQTGRCLVYAACTRSDACTSVVPGILQVISRSNSHGVSGNVESLKLGSGPMNRAVASVFGAEIIACEPGSCLMWLFVVLVLLCIDRARPELWPSSRVPRRKQPEQECCLHVPSTSHDKVSSGLYRDAERANDVRAFDDADDTTCSKTAVVKRPIRCTGLSSSGCMDLFEQHRLGSLCLRTSLLASHAIISSRPTLELTACCLAPTVPWLAGFPSMFPLIKFSRGPPYPTYEAMYRAQPRSQ